MTRFSCWVLVCVVVAAAVLAALGWISLRQWERSAEAVAREQARDMAAMAAEKIEMVLRDVPDDVIARLRTAVAARVEALPASAGLPCHVLWANRDTLLSRRDGSEFARDLGASFTVVDRPKGAGPVDHDWMYRYPALFVVALILTAAAVVGAVFDLRALLLRASQTSS